MTNLEMRGKPKAAMLANVEGFMELVDTLKNREPHLPGIGVAYGESGYGKSMAAAVAAANGDGVYVEMKGTWTRKYFLQRIAAELGCEIHRDDASTSAAICQELLESDKYLIVDEADILVDKGKIDIVRELQMDSQQPVILIGEEALKSKLNRPQFSRVYNRVLRWQPFHPASLADTRALVALYLPGLKVADDLLTRIIKERHGVTRRIVTNLDEVRQTAEREGVDQVTLEWWGNRPLSSGDAPSGRR